MIFPLRLYSVTLPRADLRDHPEAVILVFEYPFRIVKGRIRECGKHGL